MGKQLDAEWPLSVSDIVRAHMAIEITLATAEDLDWCADQVGESEPWKTLGVDRAKYRRALDWPGVEIQVARREQHRLGFLRVTLHSLAGQPYINTLFVAAEARNQGVGSDLLRFAERRFAGQRWLFIQVS